MKILIPTCKTAQEIEPLLMTIRELSPGLEVHASCLRASASVNRNRCLEIVQRDEVAIMIDDDIAGFYGGWVHDLLIAMEDTSVVMVSARLLTPDGLRFGPTCSRVGAPYPDEIEVKFHWPCVLPTAAIAFRHQGHTFDEQYQGSGWEDNDWCLQYLTADPSCKFVQSNRCKLRHMNEMKNQHGPNWWHNRAHFMIKWSHISRESACPV